MLTDAIEAVRSSEAVAPASVYVLPETELSGFEPRIVITGIVLSKTTFAPEVTADDAL